MSTKVGSVLANVYRGRGQRPSHTAGWQARKQNLELCTEGMLSG